MWLVSYTSTIGPEPVGLFTSFEALTSCRPEITWTKVKDGRYRGKAKDLLFFYTAQEYPENEFFDNKLVTGFPLYP